MSDARFLFATFEALPGKAEAVAELVRGYAVDVTAEPGNRRFDAHTVQDRPEQFFVYEEYASQEAFDAHVGAPHCAVFNDAIGPLVVGGGSELTWLAPVS